jgi:hypothetical protein
MGVFSGVNLGNELMQEQRSTLGKLRLLVVGAHASSSADADAETWGCGCKSWSGAGV